MQLQDYFLSSTNSDSEIYYQPIIQSAFLKNVQNRTILNKKMRMDFIVLNIIFS